MPLYECVLIARQDISSSQVENLVGQFSEIIEKNGGRIAKSEMWGLRNLAYRVKKNRKGHYALLNIDAPSDAVQEMERIMRLNEDILRFLTVRVEELEEGPSAVLLSRHSRDDRGRGRGGPRGDRFGGPRRDGDRFGGPKRDGDRGDGRSRDKPKSNDEPKAGDEPAAKAAADAKAADAKAADAKAADTKAADDKAADTKAADTKAADAKAADAKAADAKAADAKADTKEESGA